MNPVADVAVRQHRLSPAEAELHVAVRLPSPAPVAGRVVGPHRPGVETVEVAYPLRPLPDPPADGAVWLRCVIPEPNLWTAAAPYTYRVVVEAGGERREVVVGLTFRVE